jgi:hypothetical protein
VDYDISIIRPQMQTEDVTLRGRGISKHGKGFSMQVKMQKINIM